MIVCRENGLSPVLSLENATGRNVRVCSASHSAALSSFAGWVPNSLWMNWEGERWCEIQVYQKMGLETSFPKKDAAQAGTLGTCLKPRAAPESCLSADSARKLHIFKLPGFPRSCSPKRQMWATVEPLYLYFSKTGQEILFLLDTYI